ncbi:DUF3106 domain-containing protein [Rubellicoccus peritrichatus]|uniref:DUF3106 domain-containing protein n=1 Tax=Rubellicoccus peritrichatus TaxID=3080537 RepID=A0AAQ3LD15_9BACT|nr:DUF3106 domain-containing protein [Puniceicoccus sp. CR14]WOO42232.1 DUF3106 domain-containing protein [Puniceicoccus sp. CR14]
MNFLSLIVHHPRHFVVTALAVALFQPAVNAQQQDEPDQEREERPFPPPRRDGSGVFPDDRSPPPSRGERSERYPRFKDRKEHSRHGDVMGPNREIRELDRMSPPQAGGESLDVVERFLEMPPERLAMIRALIERLEQMTPEEKEAMKERIASYRAMTRERRAHMMEEFQQIPVHDRLLLRMYWRSLPREQAKLEKEKIRSLPPEERDAYRKELLAKARESGISITPPTPPPNIDVPPPPELIPPPFPDNMRPPPPPAASAEAN